MDTIRLRYARTKIEVKNLFTKQNYLLKRNSSKKMLLGLLMQLQQLDAATTAKKIKHAADS